MLRTAVTLLVLACSVAAARGQSLGDVARQEVARRKAVAAPARLYTNQTLGLDPAPAPSASPAAAGAQPGGAQPGSPEPAPAAPPSEAAAQPSQPKAPASAAPATSPEARPTRGALSEADWRKRVADARDALGRAEVMRDALQSRINALATDFINRDDPAQRNAIQADRQRALAELDRMTREIRTLQKAAGDIQDEARRAGVPPGWLR